MDFSKLLQYDVGDGTRVKFWKHVWCGDCSLKEAFPELYGLSRARDSSVAEVIGWFGEQLHWNFFFVVHCKIGGKNLLIDSWILFTL